ncbi:hypothetical protein R4K54_13710 [Brachyspira murdochii]|uniref:hypothetical protein n=1 Tax=Brachyspira murdochii TaxID=84378 RepID=UPI00019E15A8|nr:hypothetical protein [Brachyspira murdochii]
MKPKNRPNKVKKKKIINKVIEIRKKYKYGKLKIKKLLEKENIIIGTTAIETILKTHNLYQNRKNKVRKKTQRKACYLYKRRG